MFVKWFVYLTIWNKILCLSRNLIKRWKCQEQLKDEIGVILEVDLNYFFSVFSIISYVYINMNKF